MVEAKTRQEIILTHDLDFGHLLAFSGDTAPSVFIFRLRDCHPAKLFSRLKAVLSKVEQSLEEGAIFILEDGALRIRRLPIQSVR